MKYIFVKIQLLFNAISAIELIYLLQAQINKLDIPSINYILS